ncbi:MAG: PD-(D/E)XK nuclease family protein [Gallionella sp.]
MFYHAVAQKILEAHTPPDLRGITVLIANYHVAQPLAQALIKQANVPALLLPNMLTLSDWAATITLETPIETDTQRVTVLYQTLRDKEWFGNADLWSLARELLSLMDELTRHHVALPKSQAEFTEQLVAAYAARNGFSLQFEARVVHELWYALTANSFDAVRAQQQRLAQLSNDITQPLYVLLTSSLSVPETQFLQRCGERVSVTIFDVREQIKSAENCAAIAVALQRDHTPTDLRRDAELLKNNSAAQLTGRVKLFAAHGLEQEARAAEVQIRRWLLNGKNSIAVVVQDRLVARRVRALLERAQVQVQDESGWTFATLSVSTVLMGWLETLQNDFYYQDVLDLLKSPLLFADEPSDSRKHAVFLFEKMVRKQGVVSGLDKFIDASRDADLTRALVRLRQAAAMLPKGKVTISQWLIALRNSLETLGVLAAWTEDAAGQQLLQLLGQWREELQNDSTKCSFAEWKRWLSQQLDLNTFRDMSVESPVIFTHLAATRWRSFDAVLLLGCDAKHLPAPTSSMWFNDAVRAALGLPFSTVQQDAARDDLLGLLALNNEVLVTWQAHKDGEPNMLSPHFEMLRALHELAFGDDLNAHELAEILHHAQVRSDEFVLPLAAVMPTPAVAAELLPQRISPSGYNSLVACPYQFYARHVLRLNDLDEVREEIDKRDYGTWVHAVLQRFHGEFPLLLNEDLAALQQALQRISFEVFADALAHDYLAVAWLLRWQKMLPSYLAWQIEREQAGWRYTAAEESFDFAVLENLILRGRIDRVDSNASREVAVLDYKTQTVSVLKNKLKDAGEDVQLACYATVRNAHAAAFVSLEGEVADVAPEHAMDELAQLNFTRLQTLFTQLRSGASLPANGVASACAYCEMRGLCRQGSWELKNG